MATKPKSEQEKVATQVQEDSRRSDAGDAPFSGDVKSPDEARGQVVGEPVTTSFDERTGVAQPFVKADGRQDNGAADLSEPEGARRETTREGSKTTVEETEVAIDKGIVEGHQRVADEEKAKNPVATTPETK